MTYNEAINKIDSLLVFGSRPGLDRIKKLMSLLGDPQDDLRFVHVAGTNGKGSVCNMLSMILTSAGYKTGLFTSPHITGFGERMQINGEQISENDVVKLVEQIFPIVEKMREDGDIITEFEFVTAMAFLYFKESSCDVVVLETGMGGRFDSTNVIKTPLCSVITSISFDHTAVLGDTLEKIAFEKCGIIKENGRTVFATQVDEVDDVVLKSVKEKNNVLHSPVPLSGKRKGLEGTETKYGGLTITLPLLGKHQLLNLALVFSAVEALRCCGLDISDGSVKKGVESVTVPARFEVLSREPLVIADGAHNPGGMHALSGAIRDYLIGKNIICVMGMLRDKDCRTAAFFLEGCVKRIIATTVPDSPRRQTAKELADTLGGMDFDVTPCEEPEKALRLALSEAENTPDPAVLICGSLYLVSALRGALREML